MGGDHDPEASAVQKIVIAVGKILLKLVIAAAVGLLSVLAVLANRKRILKNRRRRFMQKNTNIGICEISYGLYQMLWDAGIREENTGDLKYARRMEKKLDILEQGEYVQFIKTVQQAAYGKEMLTEEQRNSCMNFYHKIAGDLWKQMTKRKKIWWKYMKCYEIS